MWRGSGLLTLWRSKRAALLLLPFVFEALIWLVYPGGFGNLAPGFGLWALTLLLVGVNEELTSRVVVLESLRKAFSAAPAVALAGAMFGLQHLSLFATGSQSTADVLVIVVLTAIYGFALGAYQFRFSWVLPLILIHAATDYTQILTADPVPFTMHLVITLALLAYGLWLMRGQRAEPTMEPLWPRRA
jgi:membrane protease YdiL (CAAX protease family)